MVTLESDHHVDLTIYFGSCEIIEHCEECDGKVTNLTLKNNGPESLIRVEQNKNNIVVFEEVVRNGDTFSFSGVNKKGTLGTEITIFGSGWKHVQIYTSCWQLIGRGLVAGDLEVISGSSRNGGELCHLEPGTTQD